MNRKEQKDRTDYRAWTRKLRAQLRDARETIAALTDDRNELRRKISTLTMQVDHYRSQEGMVQEMNNSALRTMDSLISQNSMLVDQNSNLVRMLAGRQQA